MSRELSCIYNKLSRINLFRPLALSMIKAMPRDCAGSLQLIYQHQANQKLLEKEDIIGSLFNGEGFFRDEVGSSDSDYELKRKN